MEMMPIFSSDTSRRLVKRSSSTPTVQVGDTDLDGEEAGTEEWVRPLQLEPLLRSIKANSPWICMTQHSMTWFGEEWSAKRLTPRRSPRSSRRTWQKL